LQNPDGLSHTSEVDPESVLLNGKVGIVTGGGAGIGRGIAQAFVAFGARVAILERDPEKAERVAAELEAKGGEVLGLEVDVRDAEAVEKAVALTADRFGAIDILVNNAGGAFAAPFLETNARAWDALHGANLKHIYHCTQSVARRMVAQGRGGSLINVVSIEGVRAAPLYATYAAAKAGAIRARTARHPRERTRSGHLYDGGAALPDGRSEPGAREAHGTARTAR